MKKIFLFAILFSTSLFAQEIEKQVKENAPTLKNEIKGNAPLLLFGIPEFTYERILNHESAFGVSISGALESDNETRFTVTPYYRMYFGKKAAAGFFAEGFAMYNVIKIDDYDYYNYDYYSGNSTYTTEKGDSYSDIALGFGLGSKWITKNGVLFEINAGFGRNLLNADKNDFYGHTFVGRGGITIGYRF